jgi:hypothetical protein
LQRYVRDNGGRELMRYRELVPDGVRDVERQLYLIDLETLLTLIGFEPNAAAETRIA